MNPDIAAQLMRNALAPTTTELRADDIVFADKLARALDAIGLLAYATGRQEPQHNHDAPIVPVNQPWAGQRARGTTLDEQRHYLREVEKLPGHHPVEGNLGDVPR